jgi:DNA topoisomerase-1
MVIKLGRHGQFLACSNYPECKNTKEFQRNGAGEVEILKEKAVQETCEKCGAAMVLKTGRYGKFLACSNYPTCKNTKKILVNEEGQLKVAQDEASTETCEKCGAAMVLKTGRYGKFLACSNYPECKSTKRVGATKASGGKAAQPTPTGENCEKCGAPLVYRKGRFGPFIACGNYPKCRYTKKMTGPLKEEGGEKEKETAAKKEEPAARKPRKKKDDL